ncbi:MAG: hypothetical protein FWF91_08530, partial [Coriobacteriia bacterium]|nr:hypothetical protein [Coriobacteriia bacterium]
MEENTPPVAGQSGWMPPSGAETSQWAQPPSANTGNWAPPAQAGSTNPTVPAGTGGWAPPGAQGAPGAPGAGGQMDPADILSALSPGPTIIDTSSGKKDGLNKCPKCGATDVAIQPGTGMLLCNFCRATFELGQKEGPADASRLIGETIGSGAANITQADNTQITIKCQGCGSEVVIDTTEAMTARCHWCRQ